MAKDFDKDDGRWVTINGTHIFIQEGQSLSDAIKKSGKFKNVKDIGHQKRKIKNDIENNRFVNNKERDELWEKHDALEKLEKDNSASEKYKEEMNKFAKSMGGKVKYNDKNLNEMMNRMQQREKANELKETLKNDAKRDLGIEKGSREEEQLNELYENTNETNYVNYYLNGKKLGGHDLGNEFEGERQSAKELFAYENGVNPDDIEIRIEAGKKVKDEDADKGASFNYHKNKLNETSTKDYTQDEKDILNRYSEDYGYDKGDNLANLKSQIDYMRNPNESIHRTAERLVEGGDFLIYNQDVKDYLDERNIKYNDDNYFDKYKQDMANKIEKLYNSKTQNEPLNDDDIVNDDRKGFEYSFRTNKRDMFGVRYNRTGSNANMDFATTADRMNRNRTDYEMGGQAQKEILKEGTKARKFFDKWDNKHLSKLTQKEYNELQNDIEELKKEYAYVEGSRFDDRVKLDREYKAPKKSTNDVMNDAIRSKAKTKADRNIDAFDDNKSEYDRVYRGVQVKSDATKVGNMNRDDFIKQRKEYLDRRSKLYENEGYDKKLKKLSDKTKAGEMTRKQFYDERKNLDKYMDEKNFKITKDYPDEVVSVYQEKFAKGSPVIQRAQERMSEAQKRNTFNARKKLNDEELRPSLKNALFEGQMFEDWKKYKKSHPNSNVSLTEFRNKNKSKYRIYKG